MSIVDGLHPVFPFAAAGLETPVANRWPPGLWALCSGEGFQPIFSQALWILPRLAHLRTNGLQQISELRLNQLHYLNYQINFRQLQRLRHIFSAALTAFRKRNGINVPQWEELHHWVPTMGRVFALCTRHMITLERGSVKTQAGPSISVS